MDDAALDHAEFEASAKRGRQFERDNLKATAAHFNAASGRLAIDFENGAALLIPTRSLQDLEDAGDDVLAGVELHHDYYLRWPQLDVDFTIPGLMAGIFGTATFMEAQRRGGQSRSAVKIAASRANGAKGGRPRKATPAA